MKTIFILLFIGLLLCGCSANQNDKLQKENSQLKEKMLEKEKKNSQLKEKMLEMEKEKQLSLEKENRQLKEKLQQLENEGARANEKSRENEDQASEKILDILTQLSNQVSIDELKQKYVLTMELMKKIGFGIEAYRTDFAELPRGNSIFQLMKSGGFVPQYLAIPILQDSWGNVLYYQTRLNGEHRSYFIGSGGSDGSFVGFDQEWNQKLTEGIDIIYSDGQFILYPLAYK